MKDNTQNLAVAMSSRAGPDVHETTPSDFIDKYNNAIVENENTAQHEEDMDEGGPSGSDMIEDRVDDLPESGVAIGNVEPQMVSEIDTDMKKTSDRSEEIEKLRETHKEKIAEQKEKIATKTTEVAEIDFVIVSLEETLKAQGNERMNTDPSDTDKFNKVTSDIESTIQKLVLQKDNTKNQKAKIGKYKKEIRKLLEISTEEYKQFKKERSEAAKTKHDEDKKIEKDALAESTSRRKREEDDAKKKLKEQNRKLAPPRKPVLVRKVGAADRRSTDMTPKYVNELLARQKALKDVPYPEFIRTRSDAEDFLAPFDNPPPTAIRIIVDHANTRNKKRNVQAFRNLEQYGLIDQVFWHDFVVKIQRQKFMDKEKVNKCFDTFPINENIHAEGKTADQDRNDVDVNALKAVLENIFVLETYEINELVKYIRNDVMKVSETSKKTSSQLVQYAPKTIKQLCRELHQCRIDYSVKSRDQYAWCINVLKSMSDLMYQMQTEVDFTIDLTVDCPRNKTIEDCENCWFNGSYDSMKAAAALSAQEAAAARKGKNETKKLDPESDEENEHVDKKHRPNHQPGPSSSRDKPLGEFPYSSSDSSSDDENRLHRRNRKIEATKVHKKKPEEMRLELINATKPNIE